MMEWNTSTHGQQDPFKWFTESQLHTVFRNGSVPDWFHGIITRKTAEELLMFKPPGYFLIRVSESRIGYTLSYRVDQRCRHFMIETMEDGQYVIVGENRTHTSLQDLVDFYRRTPIMPFNQVLTVACGQSSEHHVNYAQLLVTQRPRSYTTSVLPNNLRQPPPSHPEPVDHTPPPLPHRPNHLMNSAISFPNSQPNRLYPCLEEGVKHSTAPLPTSPVPKVRKKFTANSSPWTSPPEVPLRNSIAQKQDLTCTRMASVPKSSSEPPAVERKRCTIVQPLRFQEPRPSVVTNLKSLKMKFQKKTTNPQENLYEEITKEPNDSSKVVENEYQELTFGGSPYYHTDVRLNDEVLPQEYRSPPPFAPGY